MSTQQESSLPRAVQIWIDGEAKQAENAVVSVLDRGFLYGDSVFETLRTYRKVPFSLDEHVQRLEKSAERVLIELPVPRTQISAEITRAVSVSQFEECYVRVMITRGQGALGLDPRVALRPLRVMIVAPLSPPPLEDYRNGVAVVTFQTTRVQDDTPAAGAKVGNYLVAVLAHKQAAEAGAKEALIKNSAGEIVEGATSNVFWFEGETLRTPPLSAGILAGITRHHILRAAENLGISVEMKIPKVEELIASDGVFISSSIREMLPVISIDGQQVTGGSVPQKITRLHAEFRRLAGVEPLSVA